jgi:hypothetical protein
MGIGDLAEGENHRLFFATVWRVRTLAGGFFGSNLSDKI